METTATLRNMDCIAGLAEHVPDNSVHLTVTSIPFEELFTYSGKVEDVGNNGSTLNIEAGRFAMNMRFVVEQLYRVTAPGCNVCIHIQQLLAYKNQHGFIGRRDFNGAMRNVVSAGGFHFKGEFVIQKNPQAMAQRLNLHSLMFVTGARNSCDLAPCPNDYVLVFQKPGEIAVPVRALKHNKNPGGWVTTDEWIRDAHGIWTDIMEIDVLDGARSARESTEEKHVCPLQLEVIRRLIKLYSNPATIQPDVTVLDPFMGIGSTAFVAIEQGRNAIGFELKESYYANSLNNVKKARALAAANETFVPSLFAGEPEPEPPTRASPEPDKLSEIIGDEVAGVCAKQFGVHTVEDALNWISVDGIASFRSSLHQHGLKPSKIDDATTKIIESLTRHIVRAEAEAA